MPQRRKPTEPQIQPKLTRLICSRAEAQEKIQAQISKGQELLARQIRTEAELSKSRADRTSWSQYNHELLLRLFDNTTIADEYDYVGIGFWSMNPSFEEKVHNLRSDIQDNINRLVSIVARLELIPEAVTPEPVKTNAQPIAQDVRSVFIVHGHDNATREAVARFITKLNLEPIILAEEPNAGKTIIEKLEASSNVGFVVVLLTPDDVGAAKSDPSNLKSRARQNVILELGYFVGRLGRERVCGLYQAEVELPSDYHGVAYVSLDSAGAWKFALAREMKAAGMSIDLNLAI